MNWTCERHHHLWDRAKRDDRLFLALIALFTLLSCDLLSEQLQMVHFLATY